MWVLIVYEQHMVAEIRISTLVYTFDFFLNFLERFNFGIPDTDSSCVRFVRFAQDMLNWVGVGIFFKIQNWNSLKFSKTLAKPLYYKVKVSLWKSSQYTQKGQNNKLWSYHFPHRLSKIITGSQLSDLSGHSDLLLWIRTFLF